MAPWCWTWGPARWRRLQVNIRYKQHTDKADESVHKLHNYQINLTETEDSNQSKLRFINLVCLEKCVKCCEIELTNVKRTISLKWREWTVSAFLIRHGSGSAWAVRSCGSRCQEEDPRGPAQTAPSPKPQETGQSHTYCTFIRWHWQKAVRTSLHGQEWWAPVLKARACTPLFSQLSTVMSNVWILISVIIVKILCMFFQYVFLWLLLLFDISFSPLVCVSLCLCTFLSAVLCTYMIHLTSKYRLLSNHETPQA